MIETADLFTTERFSALLRIRRDRIVQSGSGYVLRDHDRVAVLMTRWLTRCVGSQGVIAGPVEILMHGEWKMVPHICAVIPVRVPYPSGPINSSGV